MNIFSSTRKSQSPKDGKDKTPPKDKAAREAEKAAEKAAKEAEKAAKKAAEEKEKAEKLAREKAEKEAKRAKIGIKITSPAVPAGENNKKVDEKKQEEGPAGHTKPYEYTKTDDVSPTNKDYSVRGFTYEKDPSKQKPQEAGQLSPTSEAKRVQGIAFNYAPGEDEKLKEKAGRPSYQLSPKTRDKLEKGQLSPKTRDKLLREANLSPKTRAKLSAFNSELPEHKKDSKSYSPLTPGKHETPGTGTYKTIDPSAAFIDGEKNEKIADALTAGAIAAGLIKPESAKKRVKIMVIISRVDPKSKVIDTPNGTIEHSIGVQEHDKVETRYGVIDLKNSTIEVVDPQSGEKKTFKGTTDPETSQIIFNTGGVINSKTNKLDDSLGQIIAVAPQDLQLVEVIAIKGELKDDGKIDTDKDLEVEKTNGLLNEEEKTIQTKYGTINLRTCQIEIPDKNGKTKTVDNVLDPLTGQALIKDADGKHARLVSFGTPIDPIVEVTTVSGKLDRKGGIDKKGATVECTSGQIDLQNNKITTKYGQIDIKKQRVAAQNAKTGKIEVKDATIDAAGQIVLKNQVNPKTNKPDRDYGRVVTIRIVQSQLDKDGKPILNENNEVKVSPKTQQVWVPVGHNPANNEPIYAANHLDKLGNITVIYGYFNPKTNEVERITKLDDSVKVDPVSGQVYTITGDKDESTGEPLYSASQVDKETGEVLTKVGKIDPKTGRMVIIRILIVTKRDERGKPQELDPKTVEINPQSGVINKTVYVYKMVDPVTGETVQVDPNDPRIAGARTTVTQTLTLSGEIDEKTGRIKTEWGHIDPNTGNIDPATAVRDPVTGKLILNYADIEPSHFGKDVAVTKETVPITRDQFYEGIKHLDTDVLRRDSDDENEPEAAPGTTVVKTTTKQTLTAGEGGITKNVEEQVHNIGTGEITFSTQEHKVCGFL